jgi:UDP-3-O-[3-hydroxymyristoyl] glucosamine N-acyltransferase
VFTGNTINLAAVMDDCLGECVRDGLFSYVGKAPTRLDRRVIPASKLSHIAEGLETPGVAGMIVTPDIASHVPQDMILAIADDPVTASLHVHEKLCMMDGFLWEHFDTRIDPTARIHPSAVIAERDVIIGPGVTVGPTSVVLERSHIEENAHVGVGVVVGLDAFEIFEEAAPRRILKQAGGVWIQPHATILAHCTVVRATFGGYTRIERNAMIDVLIHIAHDAVIGTNSTVVACAEISGRCELGEGSYIGPNACLRNGVRIGKNATVSMGSVVTRDVPDDMVVSGNFAVPHADWLAFVKGLGR